jgi:hypothetical protein
MSLNIPPYLKEIYTGMLSKELDHSVDVLRYLHSYGQEYHRKHHIEHILYPAEWLAAREDFIEQFEKLLDTGMAAGYFEENVKESMFDYFSTEAGFSTTIYDETVEEWETRVAELPKQSDTVTFPVRTYSPHGEGVAITPPSEMYLLNPPPGE